MHPMPLYNVSTIAIYLKLASVPTPQWVDNTPYHHINLAIKSMGGISPTKS